MQLNTVIIVGRMVKDCEIRYNQAGTAIGTFTLALSKSWTKDGQKKEEVSFIGCVAFTKTATLIEQYVHRGDELGIRGELKQDRWEKDGVKHSKISVIVKDIMFGKKAKQKEIEPQSQQEVAGMDEAPF